MITNATEYNKAEDELSDLQERLKRDVRWHVLILPRGNRMKALCVVATMLVAVHATTIADVVESSATGNVQALAGKWKPVKSSLHLLDSELVSSGQAGFEISIDKELGDSHRKSSALDTYYEGYSAFLRKNGHEAIASGYLKFDHGAESECVISQKNGSLYLWYGVVTGGNPRIFIGRGREKQSADTLVIEWASWCSESPADLERDFTTVIYERVDRNTKRRGQAGKPANK